MLHMLIDHMFYIAMNMFDITMSMINNLLYVIIIMLIYGIKMIWKLSIYLTPSPNMHAAECDSDSSDNEATNVYVVKSITL